MDSELSGMKIEKLNENNFHVWKVKIRTVLSIRELEIHLDAESSPIETESNYNDWWPNDSKARSFIGLSLSTNHLESRCQQEEQHHNDRDQQSIEKSKAVALIAKRSCGRGDCVHCRKHNDSSKYWKKFIHL